MTHFATTPADVIAATARFYQLDPGLLLGNGRTQTVALARHVAMFLSRRLTNCSFPELGLAFGKDHTTVMAAVVRIEARVVDDAMLAEQLVAIQDLMSETKGAAA